MATLKRVYCVAFLAVLTVPNASAGLITSESTDFQTNNTLDFQDLNNIDTYTTLLGNVKEAESGDSVERTELTPAVGISKNYTWGNRIPGDRLVALRFKVLRWSIPQNVRVTLVYPTWGIGALISFGVIAVDQSNNDGRAYVLNGGIKQRHITIAIEAVGVTYIALAAEIYGR